MSDRALLTDLYQLTMAYGYFKSGLHDREAVFHLHFRNHPFGSGFSIAGGLAPAIDYLLNLHFDEEDVAHLGTLTGRDGKALFDKAFLDHLRRFELACDIEAIPEGTVVFPHEPLLRVSGPILQAQLIETALLNLINFQTLIATKAARICQAARGDDVLEFGLRRAQGNDGALSATRAAYLGGCSGTSNVLAGKRFGIPVRGTHAHSWVMAFDDERAAFSEYARQMPNNSLFLVDTYDTLQGVRNAVEVGQHLRSEGHELLGVRLDSGDLAQLSMEARKILDDAGFPKAAIVASNDLDEYLITKLKAEGAAINVWGVGTRLATAWDQPALGGVYKLGAIRDSSGAWEYRIKVSEQSAKTSIPGVLQVRRFMSDGMFSGDMIFNELEEQNDERVAIDPANAGDRVTYPASSESSDLLQPIFRKGALVYEIPPLSESRLRTAQQLARLQPSVRELVNPAKYRVGLSESLHGLRAKLVEEGKATRNAERETRK